jgi:hypothetical protein
LSVVGGGQPGVHHRGGEEYDYETLNDYLLRSFHSSSPLQRAQQGQYNPPMSMQPQIVEASMGECAHVDKV